MGNGEKSIYENNPPAIGNYKLWTKYKTQLLEVLKSNQKQAENGSNVILEIRDTNWVTCKFFQLFFLRQSPVRVAYGV